MARSLTWVRRVKMSLVLLAVAAGCQASRQQRIATPAPVVVPGQPAPAFPPPSTGQIYGSPTVPGGGVTVPPPPAPAAPGAGVIGPGSQVPGTPMPPAPMPTPPGPSNYPPQDKSPGWQPAPGSVKLLPPEVSSSESAKKPLPKSTESPEPPAAKTPPPPALPAGIPQFAPVQDGVANGLRPTLDGLDWLQTNGYRTVLHIRKPGADDSADRKQIDKRGLKYLSLEASPQTLSRTMVTEFSMTVSDKLRQPLFVYDEDGALAGGLWYLHFRLTEQASDDAARVRSGALGFRADGDDAHRSMWLAVQQVLRNP